MWDDSSQTTDNPGSSFHDLIGALTAAYDALRYHADWLEVENARLSQDWSVPVETVEPAARAPSHSRTPRPGRQARAEEHRVAVKFDEREFRARAEDGCESCACNGEVDSRQRSTWTGEVRALKQEIFADNADLEIEDSIWEAARSAVGQEDGQEASLKLRRNKSSGLKHFSSLLAQTPIERACSNWTKLLQGMLNVGDRHHVREVWDEEEGWKNSLPSMPGSTVEESSSGSACSDVVLQAWTQVSRSRTFNERRSSTRRSMVPDAPSRGGFSTCYHFLNHLFFVDVVFFLQGLVIHPYSAKRLVWVFVGIVFMGFDILVLTMSVFGLNQDDIWVKVLETITAVYWTSDMVVSGFTGIYVNNEVDMDLSHAAQHYLKTWCGFDAFMVVMQWLIMFLDGVNSETGMFRYARVLRYSRLLRLAKVEQLVAHILERVNSLLVLLAIKMSLNILGVILYVHVTGAAWYWVGKHTEDGWVQALGDYDALPLNYLVSVHWAAAQLQGNVDIYPGLSAGERAFAICHVLCSVVVLASLVSKLTTVLHNIQTIKATKIRQVTQARRYLEDHAISIDLSMAVRKYVEWKQVVDSKRHHNTHESELLQILPRDLRRALLDEARSPVILRHVAFVAFRNCNVRFFQRLCCDSLEPLSYMPDEQIFSYGMLCSRMYFMVAGTATYFRYGVILQALMHNGGTFIDRTTVGGGECKERMKNLRSQDVGQRLICEPVMWAHWVHRGDLDTLSHVSILGLDMKSFDDLVLSYPVVQMSMLAHAHRFVAALNDLEELSDLFCSAQLLQECASE